MVLCTLPTTHDEKSLARVKRGARQLPYDPQPLIDLIQRKMELYEETERGLCDEIGVDKGTIRRIREGQRPSMTTLILLANHWQVPPNEMLVLGGWPRLAFFESEKETVFSPDVVEVARTLEEIKNQEDRARVLRVIHSLLGALTFSGDLV